MFLRIHVFHGPGFSEYRFLKVRVYVQVFQGPRFSGSTFLWVQVFHCPSSESDPGLRIGPGFSGFGSKVRVQFFK